MAKKPKAPVAPPRATIDPALVAEVLTKSRRRCCLCFGLHGDLNEKSGQIAHVDRDRTNNTLDNLAFMCLEHHDEYDTKTSQSKGLTEAEAKYYRTELYRVLAGGATASMDKPSAADLARYLSVIDRFKGFIHWVARHPWQAAFHINNLGPMLKCLEEDKPPDEEFKNPELRRLYDAFFEALSDFDDYLVAHSDADGMMQSTRPNTAAQRRDYPAVLKNLEKKSAAVAQAYTAFVHAAKSRFDV